MASIVNRSSFLIGELLLGKLGETVVVAYLGPAVLTPLPSGRQNRHNRGVALRKLRFLEESLMPRTCVCVALVAIFTLTAYRSAQAQVTVDVTKVNCDQFVHHKISEPRLIAAWLSGGLADVSQQPCRRYRGGRPLCAANGRLPDSLLSCHPTPRTTVLDVVWCDIKSDRGVDLASDYRGVPMGPCA